MEKVGGRGDEEVAVLKEGERAEIQAEAHHQPATPRTWFVSPFEHRPDDVVESRRAHQEEEKLPVPGRVENVTANEQPELAGGVVAERPVDTEDRDEEPEETELDEKHQ